MGRVREATERPMYDMLLAAGGRRAFHMPGHKGRAPFGSLDPYALDTTELPNTDDLYAPEGGILRAQRLYAEAAGAAETIFLHGGSTAGIHAMLQLWAREGEVALLPRNAHLSAVNACILGGLRVRWIPVTQRADGYGYVREADVLAAMAAHPEAKVLLLTRPDYYGGCMPLEAIIQRARSLGIRVAVDEAHGAHLPWLEGLPSAGECGADAWVQSVHKTLPGFTAGAVLHLRDEADRGRALTLLRREQTSSPSFLLMLGIDDARAFMQAQGAKRLRRVIGWAEEIRALLPSLGYEDAHQAWRRDIGPAQLAFDPTRLVIDAPQGGETLAEALRAQGTDVEMNDLRRVVLILTAMDEEADFLALRRALESLPPLKAELPLLPDVPALPPRRMEVRTAAMAGTETVPLERAAGRIAAAAAGLYPPGIPLVCPGEEITREIARCLAEAEPRRRFGTEGDGMVCVMNNV